MANRADAPKFKMGRSDQIDNLVFPESDAYQALHKYVLTVSVNLSCDIPTVKESGNATEVDIIGVDKTSIASILSPFNFFFYFFMRSSLFNFN